MGELECRALETNHWPGCSSYGDSRPGLVSCSRNVVEVDLGPAAMFFQPFRPTRTRFVQSMSFLLRC